MAILPRRTVQDGLVLRYMLESLLSIIQQMRIPLRITRENIERPQSWQQIQTPVQKVGNLQSWMYLLKKAGVLHSVSNDDSSGLPVTGTTSESSEQVNTYESEYVEDSASTKYLEVYRCKFRPILVECFSMLSFSQARPLLTRALEEGNFDSLVDSRLRNNYNQSEMSRMVACAAACVHHSARRRPRMSQGYCCSK